MANAISYIKNVGKSVSYVSFKAFKEMNPVFNDFAETNGELARDMYKTVRDFKRKLKTRRIFHDASNKIMETEYGKFGEAYLENLWSDLKTGKFYNKERIDKYGEESAMSFAGIDGNDMDFGFDDNFGDLDSFGMDDDAISTNEMIDIVGEKTSNAISNTLARSSEYIVQGIGQSNRAIYNQMNNIYGGLHTGLSTINQNISKIIEFSSESVTTHFENSRTFYQEISNLDRERNQYLKDISETLKLINNPQKKSSSFGNRSTYSDLITSEGNLDFSRYASHIKKNINDKTGGVMDMVNMMIETGMLMTLADSPLSGLLQTIITAAVPGTIKKSMENLNKSLSGMTGNALLGIKNKAKNKGGIWDTISEIFGINTSLQKTIDPSKYEKGKIPFDGVTKKAIVEVIPTYLSKILSTLSGNKEDRFNYDTGKFVTVDELKEQFNNLTKESANRAAHDLDYIVRDKKKSLSFRNEKEQKQFEEDWEAIKLYMFNNQKNFNTRDKSLNGKSFGLKGELASDVNVKLLQKILDGNPEMLRYADRMFRETDTHNRRMTDLQNSGTMTAIANGSISNVASDSPSGTRSIASLANSNVLSELVAIHKELSYIRIYGAGRSTGKNKSRYRSNFDNFEIPNSRAANDRAYDEARAENAEDRNNMDNVNVDDEVSRIMNNSRSDTTPTSSEKSFSQRMHEASGISAKMSVLIQSASELAKKPAKLVVAMMDKADERLYDVVYGTKDDPQGKKSFIGKLFSELEGMFDKFSDFVTDTIIDPLKGKFSKENVHDAAKKFFGIFGIDLDKSVKSVKEYLFGTKDNKGNRTKSGLFGNFVDNVKSEFSAAGKWVKNAFKDVGNWFGATSKMNKQGEEKAKRNSEYDEKINRFEDIVRRASSRMTEAATGIKRVNKTGLAVISEGEMVLPPDMNPFNIAKRQRNERRVKQQLKSGIDSIFEFNEGTKDGATGEKLTKEEQEQAKARVAARLAEKYRKKKEKFTREDYERLPMWMRISDEAVGAATSLFTHLKENMGISEEASKDFKDKAIDFMGKIKDHGHSMVAGAGIGAGVSLLTGLIGGPLVGAAVGAGVGLIKNSESVQKMLFGDIGKDGQREGGLISKDLSNNIQKYLPDMSKGATVGGILTALPIVPGGPIAGVILGSALGFAKNNENVQNALFGEGKLLGTKEQFQKKVQRVLPKMGVGALAGLVAGPFGLTTNILLGSALGFASDTDKFKNLMFGEPDEDGKRDGGIFGAITAPAKDFFEKMYGEFKTFLTNDIIQPVANAIQPIAKQFEIMGDSIKHALFDTFKKHIGEPIERALREKVINPLGKFFGGLINVILKPVKAIVSSPFKLIGGIGNALRKRQIKRGQADYMGAEQRMAFRKSRGVLGMGLGDNYEEFDKSLVNISSDDLGTIENVLAGIKDSKRNVAKTELESFNKIKKEMYSKKNNVDTSIAKDALKMLKDGGYEDAIKFVKEANIAPEAKNRILGTLAKESAKMKVSNKMRENSDATINETVTQLQKLGINLSPKQLRDLSKGDKEANKLYDMIVGEQVYRKRVKSQESSTEPGSTPNPIQNLNQEQQERHQETIDNLKAITERLQSILDINSDMYKQSIDNQIARNTYVAGLSNSEADAVAAEPEAQTWTSKRIHARRKITGAASSAAHAVSQGVSTASTSVKNAARSVRNSSAVNYMIGDRSQNKNWQPNIQGKIKLPRRTKNQEVAVVSEGEVILPSVLSSIDPSNINEYATGGVSGDKNNKSPNRLLTAILNIEKGISKLTGVSIAKAFKDGIDVDEVDVESSGDIDTYLSRVKNRYKKATSTVTEFIDGLPMKYTRDKNGDLIPDSSSAENKDTLKAINEKQETQKGILSGIKEMSSNLSGFLKGLFADDEDKKEGLLQKLFKFLSGGNLGSVISGIGTAVTTAVAGGIPLILASLGLSGKFDNVASKLTNGLFGKKDSNKTITITDENGKKVQIQTDENGNPITDENGNYLAADGTSVSSSSYLETNGSLATMSLSERLKYNLGRGLATGKGSIATSFLKKNKLTRPFANAAKNIKKGIGGGISKIINSATDTAVLSDIVDQILDGAIKWSSALKKVPILNKFADKIDDLGLKVADLAQKHLPKAGKSLAGISKSFARLNFLVAAAAIVVDFTSGYQDASTILKIRSENVTMPQKIICGLVRTVKNFIPIIGTFIPDSIFTDLFINYVANWFGIDVSKIKEQQSAAQAELDAYNEANKTDLSWAEYNKQVLGNYTWSEKVGNAVSSFRLNWKEKGFGKAVASTKSGQWVSDKVGGIKNTVKTAVGAVGEKIDVFKDVANYARDVVKESWKSMMSGDETESDKLKVDEDDPNAAYKKNVYNIIKALGFIPSSIVKIGKNVWDKGLKPFIGDVKTVGSGIKFTVTNLFSKAWSGDLAGAFNDTTSGTFNFKGVSFISRMINDTIKVPLMIPTLLTAGVGAIVRGFDDFVAGAKTVGSGLGSTVMAFASNMWDGNVIDAFTDQSNNAQSGNNLVDTISVLVNNAVKIPLAVPGLIGAAIGAIVHGFDDFVEGAKTIGSGIVDTTKSIFTNAWNGNLLGAFSDQSNNAQTGNFLVDTISKVTNNSIKIPLAIPTLLASGVGLVIRNFDNIVDSIKTIGSGIGTTYTTISQKAWDGHPIEALTDQSGDADTGNGFVDTVSKIINNSMKIPLAVPAFIYSGIGLVVRNFDNIVNGVKTVGSGISETATNLFSKAWSGDLVGAFNDVSGDANTGNGLVDTISKILNRSIKIPLAVPGLITSGVGFVVRNFDNIITGVKTIGSSLSDTVSSVMDVATNGDNPLEEIFSTDTNANTGIGTVDKISALINGVIKVPLTPIALLTAGISSAIKGITNVIDDIKEAGTLSVIDQNIIDKSKTGDVNPFTADYWNNHTQMTGLSGGINKFITLTQKVFNLPAAMMGFISKNIDDSFIGSIVKFFKGEDDIDPGSFTASGESFTGSSTGYGSGIYVGRASNLNRLVEKSQSNEIKNNIRVSNNEFISQLDSRYRDKQFNISGDTERQTLGDTGCAPAAAAMAINSTIGTNKVSMDDASRLALRYKVKNDGVNASYFNDEFARHGVNAQYITSHNSKARNQEIVRQLINNNKVVLMGQDQNNISKSASPFGPNPHYVVANGMSPDGKYIYINDPEAKIPNIRYKTENILKGSQMGISAAVARGSRTLTSKIRKFVGRASLPGADVAEKCWNYFRSKGFSEEATAGILGNLKQESNMDPTLLQNGRGPAAGICQMETYGDYSTRWGDMAKLAESRGRDWTDLESQLDFMMQDMPQQFSWFTGKTYTYGNGTQTWWPEKMTLDQYKQLKDIDKATEVFERVFERPSIPMREKRKQYAREYYTKFTGKFVQVGDSSTGTTSTGSTASTGTVIDEIYNVFSGLAQAYGIGGVSSSSDISTGTVKTADGNVSANSDYAAKQKALVEKMYSVEGKLKYAQNNAKYPGSRNPEDGSGDCSSTVQWAYQKILGIDPGSWTGAQEDDTDTYTVANNVNDESKLQLGDLILYRKGGQSSHVEMYAGNGKMIGHGSGYGPKIKDLQQNYGSQSVAMVKRWVGFKGSGSGLTDYIGRGSKNEIAENAAYDSALRHIKPNQFKSLLPMGYDEEKIKDHKISVMSYGKNKLSDVTIRNANGRASLIETVSEIPTATRKDTPVNTDNNMIELVKSIVKLLAQEVANTDKLNTIVKLLGEYMSAVNTSDDSKQSKEVALVARQNLINAMQSGGGSSQYSNPQLMKLIEATERIARE